MKRSVGKILTLMLVIAVFVVTLGIRSNINLDENIRQIANATKKDTPCSYHNEKGKTYYTKNKDGIKVYTSPSETASVATIGSDEYIIKNCTKITVYCEQNGYYRISKVKEYWVKKDSSTIKSSQPSSCSGSWGKSTTTTADISPTVSIAYEPVERLHGGGSDSYLDMYSNMEASLKATLYLSNIYVDDIEEKQITLSKIKFGGTDVTSWFTIQKGSLKPSGSGGYIVYSIAMKSSRLATTKGASGKYKSGDYTLVFKYRDRTCDSYSFKIVGQLAKYQISYSARKNINDDDRLYGCTNCDKFYNDVQNEWTIKLNNGVFPTDLTAKGKDNDGKYLLELSVRNADDPTDTNNYISGYTVQRTADTYTIKNRTKNNDSGKRPTMGNYYFVVSLGKTLCDPSIDDKTVGCPSPVSEVRTQTFHISGRYLVFKENDDTSNTKNLRNAVQINRYSVNALYLIRIKSLDWSTENILFDPAKVGACTKGCKYNAGVSGGVSLADFSKVYDDINLDKIDIDKTGVFNVTNGLNSKNHPYMKIDINGVTVKFYGITRTINSEGTVTKITYHIVDNENVAHNMTKKELTDAYPGIDEVINQVIPGTSVKKYDFASGKNGYLRVYYRGVKVDEERSNLDIGTANLLSTTGGTYTFQVKHKGLYTSDQPNKAVNGIVTPTDAKKTSVKIYQLLANGELGREVTPADGFTIDTIPTVKENSISAWKTTKFKMTYDNTDLAFTGIYKIRFTFDDCDEPQDIVFILSDGEIDYYTTANFDGHYSDPLDSMNAEDNNVQYPPSNKKYEYNIGYYIMRSGGKVLTDRNTLNTKPRVEIYPYEVSCASSDGEFDSSVSINCSQFKHYIKRTNYELVITHLTRTGNTPGKETQVKFKLVQNGVEGSEQTMSIDEFKQKYYEAAYALKNLKTVNGVPAEKPVNGTKESPTIISVKMDVYQNDDDDEAENHGDDEEDEENKTTTTTTAAPGEDPDPGEDDTGETSEPRIVGMVEYNIKGKIINKPIEIFARLYPEAFVYIQCNYVKDGEGKIIQNRLKGQYIEPISGQVESQIDNPNATTNKFDIVFNSNYTDLDKIVSITPKGEITPGTYYAYFSHVNDDTQGIGYINYSAEPVIPQTLFPELWKRNTHMSILTYSAPMYSAAVSEATYSNTEDEEERAYANVVSNITFEVERNYIYDTSAMRYQILDSNNRDASSQFIVDAGQLTAPGSLENIKNKNDKPIIKLTTRPGYTVGGTYKLKVTYNKGPGGTDVLVSNDPEAPMNTEVDFSVNPKFYNITFDKNQEDFAFPRNKPTKKIYNATLKYITPAEARNVKISIDKYDAESKSKTPCLWKPTNTESGFFEAPGGGNGFSYKASAVGSNYTVELTNIKNGVPPGDYILTLSYKEEGNYQKTTEVNFTISDNMFMFKLDDKISAKINGDQYSITKKIYAKYMDYEDLEYINYTIMYFDRITGREMDVSSPVAERKMFTITDYWPEQAQDVTYGKETYERTGTLYITLNKEYMDLDGYYYIIAEYKGTTDKCEFGSLRGYYNWDVNLGMSGNFIDDGEVIPVDKFYLNVDEASLTLNLDTPHTDVAKVVVANGCGGNSCIPSSQTDLSDKFEYVSLTSKQIVMKYRDDLEEEEKLTKGQHQVIVYYSDNDYKVLPFDVITEYSYIEFTGSPETYSDLDSAGNKTADGLYKNKKGHITIPVKVYGVPYSKVTVSVTKNGSGSYLNAFTFDKSYFEATHNLEFTYNQLSGISVGNYDITVSYVDLDGRVISDNAYIELKDAYFNFELGDPTYEPDPPIANANPYGIVKFDVATEDIENVSYSTVGDDSTTQKHVFAQNTVIKDRDNIDVTDSFEIYATPSPTAYSSFLLNIKYLKNTVMPGTYSIKTSFKYNNYTIVDSNYFEIADYEKDFDIKDVKIFSNTPDEVIHSNTGGTIRIDIESIFDIDAEDISVSVTNDRGNFVTDKFDTEITTRYIRLDLEANVSGISSGNHVINLIYTDPTTGKVKNHTVNLKMYGEYKDIVLSNMNASTSPIYADVANQYYTFSLDTTTLTSYEKNNVSFRITDSYENILYSSLEGDNVTNSFDVVCQNKNDGKYRINILAFKTAVDEYKIQAFVKNSAGDYNLSNRLEFNIEDTYYQVRLRSDSTIYPIEVYNNDLTKYYDVDGIEVDYIYTSTYEENDAEYSMVLYQNGLPVRIISEAVNSIYEEFGVEFLNSEAEIRNIPVGTYELALCMNGLPYESRTVVINEYIPIEHITLIAQEEIIRDGVDILEGRTLPFTAFIEPENATNKNITYTSSDNNIFRLDGMTIIPVSQGTATLSAIHRDAQTEVTVNVTDRIASDLYHIDYDKKIIYVNKRSSTLYTRKDLTSALKNLSPNFKIYDHSNKLTSKDNDLIGTKSRVISAGETYTVMVIGDVVPDGKIDLNDVTYAFRIYRGTYAADELIALAARADKKAFLSLNDVTLLFRFYRGTVNEI